MSFIKIWSGFSIDELPMLKEIIEESGRKIIIDHKNYDLITYEYDISIGFDIIFGGYKHSPSLSDGEAL